MKTLLTLLTFALLSSLSAAEDQVTGSSLSEGKVLKVEVLSDSKPMVRTFQFPEEISDYKVVPFMPGESIFVAAKPSRGEDWFWGIGYLKVHGAMETKISKWKSSPPKDAVLLAIQKPGGDSVVIHAARFVRASANVDEITSYAYVNHCPVPVAERDPIGLLYIGKLGDPSSAKAPDNGEGNAR